MKLVHKFKNKQIMLFYFSILKQVIQQLLCFLVDKNRTESIRRHKTCKAN